MAYKHYDVTLSVFSRQNTLFIYEILCKPNYRKLYARCVPEDVYGRTQNETAWYCASIIWHDLVL